METWLQWTWSTNSKWWHQLTLDIICSLISFQNPGPHSIDPAKQYLPTLSSWIFIFIFMTTYLLNFPTIIITSHIQTHNALWGRINVVPLCNFSGSFFFRQTSSSVINTMNVSLYVMFSLIFFFFFLIFNHVLGIYINMYLLTWPFPAILILVIFNFIKLNY